MDDEDWGGSNDYWGSPQDPQQDAQGQQPQQDAQSQPPQGIPGMTPMPPQQSQQGIPGMQGGQQFQQGGFPQNQGFPQGNSQMGQQPQQGGFSQNQGFPQGNSQMGQQGIAPQGQQASQAQQDKPKSDNKSFVMILVILVVIAVVTVGVYFFQKGIKEKNAASITTSQQAQPNSGNSQSKSPTSRPSQSAPSSPSEKSPNTSWDSSNGDSGKASDVHGLSEVGSLPDVASRGSSGAIVASKHVYTLDNGYVYSLELSLSTGQSNNVEFFVSKDNFDKINTGTIVSVEYVKYSDGRVGITSISGQGNSSEN